MEKTAECKVEKVRDVLVVMLPRDSLDAGNTQEFKREMDVLCKGNPKVVLDLGRVEFVDSSGCGALLSCLRNLNAAGGGLKLCRVHKTVRALFELIRMHRIFDILETPEEAVKAFEG